MSSKVFLSREKQSGVKQKGLADANLIMVILPVSPIAIHTRPVVNALVMRVGTSVRRSSPANRNFTIHVINWMMMFPAPASPTVKHPEFRMHFILNGCFVIALRWLNWPQSN